MVAPSLFQMTADIADRQAINESMNQFLREGSRNFRVCDPLMFRFGETTDP